MTHIMLQIVLEYFFGWSCDVDISIMCNHIIMVFLAQPCVGTGETLVLVHNYFVK